MKVSVVIPVYNEEEYIGRCLQSLQQQIDPPDEIVIVDNNCTDATIEIASQFPVRIVKEKKQGMAAARKRGFNEAQYDVIARCDADSILSPTWVQRIRYNFTKRKKIDGLIGLNTCYDFPIRNVKMINKGTIYLIREIAGHFPLFGSSMAISKRIWGKIKDDLCDDNTVFHEDVDISVHIYQHKGTIVFDPLFEASFSSRRLKRDPFEFFIEYPARVLKTIRSHEA